MTTSLWINAGEASGDLHGSLLVRALRRLRPDLSIVGMTGPAMRAEGVTSLLRTESLSVMGVTEVLTRLPGIFGLLRTIRTELTARHPKAVVLIDAPDFHFQVARIARSLNIHVIYYISPKIWAWREDRVSFLRTHVNRLISILPFEVDFYARHGMRIDYVGHPLLDVVRTPQVLETPQKNRRIGILPGSRAGEITRLLPIFSRAAHLLSNAFPGLEFVLPAAPGVDRTLLNRFWAAPVPISIEGDAGRYALMRSCRAIMAASGTAVLETALLEIPTAVAYKVSSISAALGRRLIRVPYVSLPNLILNKPVFPELLQEDATAAAIAAHLSRWIPETRARADMLTQLQQIPGLLGGGDAALRAARIVLETMNLSHA
jgi:lipid-A-disaccharide synthase